MNFTLPKYSWVLGLAYVFPNGRIIVTRPVGLEAHSQIGGMAEIALGKVRNNSLSCSGTLRWMTR